ncbi:MAG: hypothetical protein HKN92_11445, partial [Chitinophagales bacterium]|nr:hypothetical protein [Chitinophagales bacterium]
MSIKLFKIFIIIVFIAGSNTVFAQKNSDILQAWDHIANNDLMAAKKSFEKAVNSDEKHYAHLGLSYVGAAISNNKLRLENYLKFITTAPNPDPYLIALWTGTGMIDYSDPDPYLEMLEEFTTNRDGTLRILAYETLGSYYESINKMSKAKEYFDKMGSIETWQVIGEFENISESGFNVDHGPLAHPEKDFDFTNKRGVDVKWFELTQARPDKWVDFAYHFYIDNSVIYAQNWVNSPTEQEVQIRIGTSGSLKFWVNDKLMFQESEERNNGLDTYIFTAKLNKGNNRVLLQIGASEISMSNFLVRITDMKGNNIQGLTFSNQMKTYPSDYAYESRTIEDPTEIYFKQKLEENNNDLQHLLALSQHYLKNDKVYPAKKILKVAKNKYPDCSYVTFQLIETYYRDDNRTGVSTYLEELKDKDPNGIQSLGLLFEEAIDLEDYKEAERLLEEKKKIQGTTA